MLSVRQIEESLIKAIEPSPVSTGEAFYLFNK